jgi:hypothetical protein
LPVELEYVPTEEVADTNVNPVPSWSVTMIVVEDVSETSPITVYVICSPTCGVGSLTVLESARPMPQLDGVEQACATFGVFARAPAIRKVASAENRKTRIIFFIRCINVLFLFGFLNY